MTNSTVPELIKSIWYRRKSLSLEDPLKDAFSSLWCRKQGRRPRAGVADGCWHKNRTAPYDGYSAAIMTAEKV